MAAILLFMGLSDKLRIELGMSIVALVGFSAAYFVFRRRRN
jgi:hypothetical protein